MDLRVLVLTFEISRFSIIEAAIISIRPIAVRKRKKRIAIVTVEIVLIAIIIIVRPEGIVLRGLTIRERLNLEPFFIGEILTHPSPYIHIRDPSKMCTRALTRISSCSVFRALDAVNMTWDNSHLKNILMSDQYCSHIPETAHATFNSTGHPLWNGKIEFASCEVLKEECP